MGKIGEYLFNEFRPMGSPNQILAFQSIIKINDKGLSNKSERIDFFYPTSFEKSLGSTSLFKAPDFQLLSQIAVTKLDNFLNINNVKLNYSTPAIFLLDVEGNALGELEEANNFLKQSVLFKFEVELRRKKPEWNYFNFLRIVILMDLNGFKLYQPDLQPRRRIDLIFIKQEISSRQYSKILFYALIVNVLIYPIAEFPRMKIRKLFERNFSANR